MSALDALVRDASLAEGGGPPRRSFTASERAGVLAMRRGAVPWRFSVTLLRAGLVLAPRLVARASVRESDGQRVLRFDVRLEHAWSTLDLAGLLEASLHDHPEDTPESRWRSLIGAAINGALATEPRWVELHTPLGGRRWTAGARAARDEDPYVQQRVPTDVDDGGMSLCVAHPAEGVAAIWARWTGRHGPEGEVARLWSEALGEPVDEDAMHEGVAVLRLPTDEATVLGAVGRWWPRSEGGLFLRRDGVRIADLGALVQQVGGAPLHGEVEAPRVKLDVDEEGVRIDEALHELIAWMQAPTLEAVTSVMLGDAQPRAVDSLRSVDEVVFAWPHRVAAVEGRGLATINALTPAQLSSLREGTPASFVPASLLLRSRGLRRVDLTSLEQGSIGPIRLGEVLSAEVVAFVHRHRVAKEGRVQVHGFGRVVFEAYASELPGVTVIGRLPRGREDIDDAPEYAEAVRRHAVSCADVLTHAVLTAVSDVTHRFRVPWFAHRWEHLSPLDLEFRYVPHGDGVRLSWRDDPLLMTTVAHEADGTPRLATDALERLRDAGGVVVAEGGGRWRTLESSVPIWTPWRLTTVGVELLGRMLGDVGLWRMPMVAEAQLRPERLATQLHVRLDPERVAELRSVLRSIGRASERARCALLAHALWSRAAGDDALGLDALPLLHGFDAEAAQPRRRVSLLDVERGAFTGVVPHGAAHRGLGRAVLEATPAVAHALVELGLVSASTVSVRSAPRRPTSRPAAGRRVWLRQRVIDPRAVGALVLAEGPPGVEVWEDGLRTRTLRLPAPYGAVAGRVWMQRHGSTDTLTRLLLHAASTMADGARRALLLSVPGSARARALQAFIETLPTSVEAPPAPRRAAAVLGSDRFAATLRFALGRAVTVEVSRVSWSLLRDDTGLDRVRVGGLHPLIRAAREGDAGRSSIGAAALAVLLALCREDRLTRAAFDEGTARVLAALE